MVIFIQSLPNQCVINQINTLELLPSNRPGYLSVRTVFVME